MKIFFKLMILGGLSLLLLLALSSIKGITCERQGRRYSVQQNIADSYAGQQQLIGPIATIAYREIWTVRKFNEKENRWTDEETGEIRTLTVFPEQLTYDENLQVQERYRGIYKANVFQSKGTLTGSFRFPKAYPQQTKHNSRIEWISTTVGISISDPRGISKTPEFRWNDTPLKIQSGSRVSDHPKGVHVRLPANAAGFEQTATFTMNLDVHGMEQFQIVPIASDNQIKIASSWPHPSFIGDFLATTRTVTDDGFEAEWNVNGLACSAQQKFDESRHTTLQHLGVDLIDPVNPYPMTDRALKYGFLFIFLTFSSFCLFEIIRQLKIHPIQYGFVGLAQAIFFLLLLSLSEHIGFGISYLIATLGTIGIITVYLSSVLKNQLHGLAFGGLLGFLYAALFGLLQSEDHALVAGSALLFGLMACVMILTRNINWYALTSKKESPAQ